MNRRSSVLCPATLFAMGWLGVAVALSAGCQGQSAGASGAAASKTPAETKSPETDAKAARKILDEMVAAYDGCHAYADVGELHVQFVANGREETIQPAPFSVTFERPNRLRLQALECVVVSNGQQLWASIGRLPGQILMLPAPPQMAYDDLFTDELLTRSLSGGIDLDIPQLKLLLLDDPLKRDLAGVERLRLLEDKTFGEHLCHRVSANGPDGDRTYWIDAKTHVLRKLQLPVAKIKKEMESEMGPVSDVEVWITFTGAQFNPPPAEHVYEFEPPRGVQFVRRFLMPPPTAPAPLVGQKVERFEFDNLAGGKVTTETLHGKVAVLEFWSIESETARKSLPAIEQLLARSKDSDKLTVLAVNIDGSKVSDDEVRAALAGNPLAEHVVRDRNEFAQRVFGMEVMPTIYVIDGEGVVQDVIAKHDPEAFAALPEKVGAVLSGANLARQTIEKYQEAQQKFDTQAAEAIVGDTKVVEIPQAKIAEASSPANFKLTELWTSDAVKSPGNLLIIERHGEAPRVLVIEDSRNIVELDHAKTVSKELASDVTEGITSSIELERADLLKRYELKLPAGAAVSYIRSGVDSRATRYALFASMQQQTFLFDDAWNLVASYPDAESKRPPIADVQLEALELGGKLSLYVSFFGSAGLHCASLDGSRIWSNRAVLNATRMAPSAADAQGRRLLFCADGSGPLTAVDGEGKVAKTLSVGERAIYALRAAPVEEGQQTYCGLAEIEPGVSAAIGFDGAGNELWNIELPKGVHQLPVELIGWGEFLGAGCWILPAADGSIRLIRANGEKVDTWNVGRAITGIAVAGRVSKTDERSLILISTASGLTAWAASK